MTGSLIIGSVPAVLVGSLLSSSVPDRYVRPAIAFVIFASGLKYVGVPTQTLGWILCATLLAGAAAWLWLKRAVGAPARRAATVADGRRSPTTRRRRGWAEARAGPPGRPVSARLDVAVAGGQLATYRLGAAPTPGAPLGPGHPRHHLDQPHVAGHRRARSATARR